MGFLFSMEKHFVYILYSEKLDKYYIGCTANIADRLSKHNRSLKGFTSNGKPWVLVYSESLPDKRSALQRERQLKNWKNPIRLKELIFRSADSEHPDPDVHRDREGH
jgi:putative endonuclease